MGRTQIKGKQIQDDSVTGADVLEESLVPSKIPFSDPSFLSTNVKAAIIEASTGGDPRPRDYITSNTVIATNRHHVIMNDIVIDADLKIDGTLGVI